MSSDRIQSERSYQARRRSSRLAVGDRAWVKRDLEFWHRCTVEKHVGERVTVSLDNLDELTVEQYDVQAFELEQGDLVFYQPEYSEISGHAAFVTMVKGEVAEIEFPASLYGKAERLTCFQRNLRFYDGLEPPIWAPGALVFAYKPIRFTPALFLLFPATVTKIHFGVCVEVEIVDGETTVAPATLVEARNLQPGDFAHTCTIYCLVLERNGEHLVLQEGASAPFESHINQIAVLPRGYRMVDGVFEKIVDTSVRSAAPPSSRIDVHVVRTDDWRDAADDPVTKWDIEGLIASDPELAWAGNVHDDGRQPLPIAWRGEACFWWRRDKICCIAPDEAQLAKLVEIAIALDANVVGDDGTEHH
jgi:hypothetical protein